MSSKREFSKVSPNIWRPGRFMALETSDQKLAYIYFLTSEHNNSAGCYRIPSAYAAADLGWTIERYEAVRDDLEAAGLIVFDDVTEEIYIERWFKHCPPMNEKHSQGIGRIIGEVESQKVSSKAALEYAEADALRGPAQGRPLPVPGYDRGRF